MAGTVITSKGRALIAKLIASESGIDFTRASVGTGKLPAGYDPGNMTGLNRYKMDGRITAASAQGDVANVTFQIASADVTDGFIVTEAGLFAADPDEGEILYAYLDLSEDPQYIYKKGSAINKVAEITLGVIIGQIERVTATIAPDGLITKEVFEKALQELREQIEGTGRVIIGKAGTSLHEGDTLFVIEEERSDFEGASYHNLSFGPSAAAGSLIWAQVETSESRASPGGGTSRAAPGDLRVIDGKLAVSEEADPDAAFFAKLNE